MANEFIIKNGFRSQGNSEITGSLSVSGSISTTSPVNLSGFANGSVLFTSGSNGAITRSSNLFWDNTNSRLGIGGTPGAFALDVQGSARVSTLRFQLSTNAQIAVAYSPFPTTRTFFDYEYEFLFRNVSAGYATPLMIHRTTNNIGINTTTDAGSKLLVRGSGATSATTALRVENTNASASLVVLDNGFVGINTGSAQFNLDVNGTTRFNGLSIIQGTTASDTAPLGIELLTTGTGDASWTGADFATGYTHVTGSTTTLTSTLAGVVNNYYQITYTVTGRTAGSFTVAFGGFTSGNLTATGAVGPRATTTDTLIITPTSDFNGNIVLSIKTISISSASVTFNNSSGTVTNQIRISNINSNTFIGLNAGSRNTTGIYNTANGLSALRNNTTGNSNTANGVNALSNNTTGNSNTANGFSALFNNTTGISNTANGRDALFSNTTGNNNTANGSAALFTNTTGNGNAANGVNALFSNTTGNSNTANGVNALRNNTTGGNNTANGANALFSNTTGNNNTANGSNAGRFIANGITDNTITNNSVFIGADAKALADNQTNQIVIGYNAIGLGSNTAVLGNDSITRTALKGNVSIGTTGSISSRLHIQGSGTTSATTAIRVENTNASASLVVLDNGYVGIGTTTPSQSLDVNGNIRVQSIYGGGINNLYFFNDGSGALRTSMGGILIGSSYDSTPSLNEIRTSLNQNLSINSRGSGSIFFQTTDTTRVTISGSNVGIGTTTPSASLHISGASSAALLEIDSPTVNNILFVSGSGQISIGSNNPFSYKLYVNGGTSYFNSILVVDPTQYLVSKYIYSGGGRNILPNSIETPSIVVGTTTANAVGVLHARGTGATSATTTFLLQNSSPINLMTVLDNGQTTFSSPIISLAASQSAFTISQSISASNVVGGQYYGVNITPTFFATTASQTETALRVAATFTGSAAATAGTNIIADFGATSAGSQFTVTDVTSGSIYMVNDVSGLPIIEATSDWTVNMYNYPNLVFNKTGSQVNIFGTLRVSGSFILPLSQSAAPQTGSAYWSGSLLFVYDGTQYRSSSFA